MRFAPAFITSTTSCSPAYLFKTSSSFVKRCSTNVAVSRYTTSALRFLTFWTISLVFINLWLILWNYVIILLVLNASSKRNALGKNSSSFSITWNRWIVRRRRSYTWKRYAWLLRRSSSRTNQLRFTLTSFKYIEFKKSFFDCSIRKKHLALSMLDSSLPIT